MDVKMIKCCVALLTMLVVVSRESSAQPTTIPHCNTVTCQKCDAQFLLSADAKSCQPFTTCQMERCKTCVLGVGGTKRCLECVTGYGTPNATDQSRCDKCKAGCSQCITVKQCATCNSPNKAPKLDGSGECGDCAEHCKGCLIAGAGKCDECQDGYIKLRGKCIKGVCGMPHCKSCEPGVGVTSVRCTACEQGYGTPSTTDRSRCDPCPDKNCLDCDTTGVITGAPDGCSLCKDGYVEQPDAICKACPEHCHHCLIEDPGTCLQCQDGYYRQRDETCK